MDSAPISVFADAFGRTTGLGSNWQQWSGSFTTDGSYAISGAPPSNGNWASVLPSLGANDYQVSATLIIPSGSLYSGLVGRSSDSSSFDDNLYAAQLSTGGTVNLYRRNSWNWTLLQSVNASIHIDQAKQREVDLFDFPNHALPANSGTVTTGFAGWTDIMTGAGLAQYGTGTAAHFGNLAGRIRIEEMNWAMGQSTTTQRYIHHALTVAVTCISGHVYPAQGSDGSGCPSGVPTSGNGLAPPLGARLHLHMNLSDIDGSTFVSVPEWKKVLLRTLIVYGAYISDTGSAFYFDWQTESGLQYTTMNVTDLWRGFGATRAAESGSDWFTCLNSQNTADSYCPDTSSSGQNSYKGLWRGDMDGIIWDTAVWANLEILAPPPQSP